MAEKPKTDTIMKLELKGRPVTAECTLTPAKGDKLMDGFNQQLQNYFEIYEFDFGMSLKESDDKSVTTDSGAFARWRSASRTEYKKIVYPLEFDKFSFKRTLDRASPIFFASCCSSVTFDTATVVKRLAQDSDRPAFGVMRIDFTKVLLTGIDWSDGELITENIDFIAQKMTITLRGQSADGTISADKEYKMKWDPSKIQRAGQVL